MLLFLFRISFCPENFLLKPTVNLFQTNHLYLLTNIYKFTISINLQFAKKFHKATVVKLYNYTSWEEVSYSVCKSSGSHVSVEVNSTLPTDALAAVRVLHGKKFNV